MINDWLLYNAVFLNSLRVGVAESVLFRVLGCGVFFPNGKRREGWLFNTKHLLWFLTCNPIIRVQCRCDAWVRSVQPGVLEPAAAINHWSRQARLQIELLQDWTTQFALGVISTYFVAGTPGCKKHSMPLRCNRMAKDWIVMHPC